MNAQPLWRILLVDDDRDDYELTYAMLRESQSHRVEIDWRIDYAQGMAAITGGDFYHAALIDYDMGEASGIQFIRAAVAHGCPFPLILYTGRGSYEVDMQAIEAGATFYLTKSEANPLLLERVIRYAIERKEVQTSLQRITSQLEQRVLERTEDLRQANERLRAEIAERQAAQQALSERESLLTQTLDSLPIGVWLIDYDGHIRQGNKAGIEVWGGAQFVDADSYHVYKGWHTDSGVQLKSDEWAALRVLANGQPIEEELEIEAFTGERKIIWSSAVPLRDANQRISGAIVVNQDITERKQAQSELYNQHALLEMIFNNPYLALALLDRDFNFVRVNTTYAELDGRPLDFFAGKNHFDLYPSLNNQATFQKVIKSGQAYQTLRRPFTYPNHPERGVTYWDWNLQPMRSPNGQVTGLLLAMLNVTDRRQD